MNIPAQKTSLLPTGALSLLLIWIVLATTVARAESTLDTRGLAVYTETARDLYIAGLRLPSYSGLNDLLLSSGPKAMEYRIATRRISSRGFSGMLLLQAELGSGTRAPETVIVALSQLKKNMQSALVKGDQFVIALSEDDVTSFHLNDTELLNIQDATIFDFFFAGWVGESSSALLREKLLSGEPDPGTLTRFEGLRPKPDRVVLVSSWMTPVAAPEPKPEPAPVAAAPVLVAAAPEPAAAPTATPEPAAATEETPVEVKAAPVAVKAAPVAVKAAPVAVKAAPTKVEVASVEVETPAAEIESVPAVAEAAMDDREYKRQLSEYTSNIMIKVFGEVRYPRRAVKKRREGRVELLLYLDADGKLLELALDNSSGHGALDSAAEKAVRKAAPFPELTRAAREEFVSEDGNSYVMPIPITFRLQD